MAGRTPMGPQLEAARRQAATLEQELAAARQELADFKEKVVKTAREVRVEQRWCRPGFNSVMEDLGLPKEPEVLRLQVELTAKQTVEIDIDADDLASNDYTIDEAGARKYVTDGMVTMDDYADGYDWEIVDDSAKIESVELITD